MQALWNKIQLERPPNVTFRAEVNNFDGKILATLNKAITELESQSALHSEATILSRLIYRMKCKFRNDKGLKAMEKVNRALLNYLALALSKEYKDFQNYIEVDKKFVRLPSKQMLEYVLVRTQGFAKLMTRIEETATQSAYHFKNRISIGHAWSISLIAYAIISRIWLLSRHLVKRCCIWYNNLYQYLEKLKTVGVPWLPKGQELPDDLKLWLNLPWIDQEITRAPTEKHLQDNMFKLIQLKKSDSDDDLAINDDDAIENSRILRLSKKEAADNNTSIAPIIDSQECLSKTDDIGEHINRSTFKRNYPTEEHERKTTSVKKRKGSEHVELNKNKESIPSSKQITALDDSVTESVDNNNEVNDLPAKKMNKKHKKNSKTVVKGFAEAEKNSSQSSGLDQIKSKKDLVNFLNNDFCQGLDKLQWNIIKKNAMKFLVKIEKCADQKKQTLLVKKAIRSIKAWIN